MTKIALPISNFFEDRAEAVDLVRAADCLELRDRMLEYAAGPAIRGTVEAMHTDLQPIHPMAHGAIERFRLLPDTFPNLRLISFHTASSCDAPIINDKGHYIEGGRQLSRDELLRTALDNFRELKQALGKDIMIAVENNNYFRTEAYRYITDGDFISSVVRDNGLWFVYDIAHARITAHNKGMEYREYKSSLPMDRVVQLHISGYDISGDGTAYDAHAYPAQDDMDEAALIAAASGAEYITPEYYKDPKELLRLIQEIKDKVRVGH